MNRQVQAFPDPIDRLLRIPLHLTPQWSDPSATPDSPQILMEEYSLETARDGAPIYKFRARYLR
jgi:hypothetical protein